MKFGTIVKFKKPYTQGYLTIDAGETMAVAHYSHKHWVDLNTYGDMPCISELVRVDFRKIDEYLEVVSIKDVIILEGIDEMAKDINLDAAASIDSVRNRFWTICNKLEELKQGGNIKEADRLCELAQNSYSSLEMLTEAYNAACEKQGLMG